MRQIRQASARDMSRPVALSYEAPTAVTSDDVVSCETSDECHTDRNVSYDAPIPEREVIGGLLRSSDQDAGQPEPAPGQRRRTSGLQRQAWRWGQANRTPTGDLPSGKAIADRFGRRERWGRLVKQTGYLKGWT